MNPLNKFVRHTRFASGVPLKVIAPGNFSESEHINANAQCHYIATDQTGFDPTRAGGGVADNEYRRLKKRYLDSITQCLIDRGYERG